MVDVAMEMGSRKGFNQVALGNVAMECRNGNLALIRKSRTVMSEN